MNHTLKSKLCRYFTAVNYLHYIDFLQDIVDSYNHKSIGRAPATVSLLNVGQVRRMLYAKIERPKLKHFKFKVGDLVRLCLCKRLFKKGYKVNWTEEVFQIVNHLPRTLVVYEVHDILERLTVGTFIEKELQKVKRTDVFCVEKVLQKNKQKIRKRILCDGLDAILISTVGFNPLILFQFLRDE